MNIVVDSSAIAGLVIGGGAECAWAAEHVIAGHSLAAPHLLHAKVANVHRRAEPAGDLAGAITAIAHAGLLDISSASVRLHHALHSSVTPEL